MLEELQRRNYSQTKTRTYLQIVRDFAKYFNLSPDQLGPAEIRTYQLAAVHRRTSNLLWHARLTRVCGRRELRKTAHKSRTNRSRNDAARASMAMQRTCESPGRGPNGHARGLRVCSTPIALPRPPQTRAASFKRLYPN